MLASKTQPFERTTCNGPTCGEVLGQLVGTCEAVIGIVLANLDNPDELCMAMRTLKEHAAAAKRRELL